MAFGEIFAGHSGKFHSAGFGSSCPLASHIINVCIVGFYVRK